MLLDEHIPLLSQGKIINSHGHNIIIYYVTNNAFLYCYVGHPWWKYVCISTFASTILILVVNLVIYYTVLATYSQYTKYSKVELQTENVTTLTERIDRNGLEITLVEEVQFYDTEHLVSVYLPNCNNLVFHNKSYLYMSKQLEENFVPRSLGVHSYIYMLQGSSLTYKICLKGLQGNAWIKLFVFDSLESFNDYQADITDGIDTSILHVQFTVNSSIPHCTELEVSVKNEDFFFFVGETNNPVTYQYNITGIVVTLNIMDYIEVCTVASSKDCTLSLKGISDDVCVLAYTHPLSKYLDTSISTHVNLDVKTGEKESLITPILTGVIMVGLIIILTITCACLYHIIKCVRNKKHYYIIVHNVTD